MPSTYTTSNRLDKQEVGANNNTWGSVWNTQTDLIDVALDGVTSIDCAGAADVNLTSNNGSSDTSRPRMLVLKGTPTSSIRINAPAVSKWYLVRSKTGGSEPVRVGFLGGTAVVTVASGDKMTIFGDGVNMYNATPTVSIPPATSVASFVTGMIIMWAGSVGAVPGGWAICDGTNGTPNLSERFIVATVSNGGVDQSGGANGPYTTDSNGAHTHGGTTGNTTLTSSQIPSHNHKMFLDSALIGQVSELSTTNKYAYREFDINANSQNYTICGATTGTPSVGETSNAGSSSGHNHSISSGGAHTHSVTATPRYYKLLFLMRT